MLKYMLKRLLLSVGLFFGITILVYFLANLAPGGPADIIAGSNNLTQEAYKELKHSMGLDRPIIVRYLEWLSGVVRGNLGISTRTNQTVAEMLSQRIGSSLILMFTALGIAIVVSLPLGIAAGAKPYGFWDNISTAVAFLGSSVPNFFIALVFIYFFAVKWRVLPAMGMYDQGKNGDVASLIRHLIMPALVLSFQMMGSIIKQTRGSILEAMNEEYIKTARAKGLSEFQVVMRHGLRNAWMPIVTTIGNMVPFLLSGAVITEQIFSWNGIGSLLVQSVSSRDYNTIMGITVVIAIAVIITNIVLDFVYSLIDPRISVA